MSRSERGGSGERPLGYSLAPDWNDPDAFAIYPWLALPFHHHPRVTLHSVQPGTTWQESGQTQSISGYISLLCC